MNNIYHDARWRLTLIYFLIIFCVVLLFSSIALGTHDAQFDRFDNYKSFVKSNELVVGDNYASKYVNQVDTIIQSIKQQFFLNIVILDLSVLTVAAVISYYLSAMTLEPIEQAFEKQKKFVSDASHELRTPLTAMKTEAEVLSRSKRATKEEYQDFTKSLVEEVDKLNSLTENLLLIARLDNKLQTNDTSEVVLSDLVQNLVTKFKSSALIKDISIESQLPESPVIAHTDKNKVERILSILIENAIKYNRPGGSVILQARQDHGKSVITVEDTGVGISKRNIDKIFDRFYRESEDRNEEGFGLGLSIAKELAVQINGTLTVESEIDKGSTFTLTL
jgi:two-component system, OmpR family, sensor histidine kinase CiaH